MPGQQGLRRHDRGHLRQKPAAEPFRLGRQTTPLVVVEPKSPATKLFFEDPILFTKIVEGELLLLIHPASHGVQQQPEWVENSLRLQSPLSRAPRSGLEPLQIHADPVSGPYGARPDRPGSDQLMYWSFRVVDVLDFERDPYRPESDQLMYVISGSVCRKRFVGLLFRK